MSGGADALAGSANNQTSAQGKQPLSKDLTPKQFLAQKKPENNYERVACLAYYLTHYREMLHFKTRFPPENGHVQCTSACLLWAKSGHRAGYSINSSARLTN